MAAQSKIQVTNINNSEEKAHTVDVLYQKMGDRWYAFSLVGDDVFVGSVTEEEINQAASEQAEIEKIIIDAPDFQPEAEIA